MDPHQLDAFAARSVGTTLDAFARAQRVPADRPRRAHTRRRRTVVALSTTLGIAAPAISAVVVVAGR